MQAVILAAGKSTRMHPLTVSTPKPLLKVANTPVMEYQLEALRGIVDEIIVVVGFGKEQIEGYLERVVKAARPSFRVTTVTQKKQEGTLHALLCAEPLLKDKFIVMGGDDIYTRQDMLACAQRSPCVSAAEVGQPGNFGVLVTEGEKVVSIIEKPAGAKGKAFVNTGLYCMDRSVFKEKPRKSKRGEYELTDLVKGFNWHKASFWQPIGYPWDLLEANKAVLGRLKGTTGWGARAKLSGQGKGKVEKGVTMKGSVWVGEGSIVKAGTYIEGPVLIGRGTVIEPNCHIRPYTTIGDNCKIGAGCEIKESIVGDGCKGFHRAYIGDSVIGEGANIGGGTIMSNLRHDDGDVKSIVKGKLIGTGRRKLGAIVGPGAKVGAGTIFYPGRKVWPGKTTLPGEIVKRDVE